MPVDTQKRLLTLARNEKEIEECKRNIDKELSMHVVDIEKLNELKAILAGKEWFEQEFS